MKELLDPIPEISYPEYFRLFKGEVASAKQIRREHPYLNVAIDNMVKTNRLVGQRTFLNSEVEIEEDILYVMPSRGGTFYDEGDE